jgi:hypothetical protein
MNGHVTKPIDPDQLFATLLKWIEPRDEVTADRQPEVTLDQTDWTQQTQPQEELPESFCDELVQLAEDFDFDGIQKFIFELDI